MTESDKSTAARMNDTDPRVFAFLKERFGDSVLSYASFRDDLAIDIVPSSIVDILRALRDNFDPPYNYLACVTADHWIESQAPGPIDPPYFNVIYQLRSVPSGEKLRLRATVKDTPDIHVLSASSIHESANWHEREVFDLFGIVFTGHPNLTRILTPETYPEHPLRRDFPIDGPGVLEFQDRLVAEWNVSEEREYTGKFGDPWMSKVLEQQKGRIYLKRLATDIAKDKEMDLPGDIAHDEQKIPDQIIKPK
jgi:NADH-quinone oxidoreductase subunit C